MIVVVDLDGTLCDSAHREHLARAKEWDQFHSLLGEDKVHQDVFEVLMRMNWAPTGETPMIVLALTGRNEKYRKPTIAWLQDKGVSHILDDLLMRPDNDWRPDHELKPALLDDWLTANDLTHADVLFILEDRDKVVEAWRNLGHNVWQVRPGGY